MDSLSQPAFALSVGGVVSHANRAALEAFGAMAAGASLTGLTQDPAAFEDFLRRASGSRQPIMGRICMRGANGEPQEFRAYANLVMPAPHGGERVLLLRLASLTDRRFAALKNAVDELNDELKARRHTQAVVEEALRERELLLRELHHRVKNNVQIILGMLTGASREAESEQARDALAEAARRLAAVAAAHQMLYRAQSLSQVSIRDILEAVTSAVLEAAGASCVATFDIEDVSLGNDLAVPLALIINELVSNAVKYGCASEGGRLWLRFSRARDGSFSLVVEDDGPGFEPSEARRRASGLGLVRGLVRQLGGSLLIDRAPGARITVRFADRASVTKGDDGVDRA
jgi:two-component sensor histidine kinase